MGENKPKTRWGAFTSAAERCSTPCPRPALPLQTRGHPADILSVALRQRGTAAANHTALQSKGLCVRRSRFPTASSALLPVTHRVLRAQSWPRQETGGINICANQSEISLEGRAMCFPRRGCEWEGNGQHSSRCCQGGVGPVLPPSQGK